MAPPRQAGWWPGSLPISTRLSIDAKASPENPEMTLPPATTDRYSPPRVPEERLAQGPRIAWYWRAALFGLGVTLLVLLGTARWLTPDASRRGTHRQLGLPPCNFLTLTGKRCPSCGM